jgi:hypothetical protein
MIGRGGFERGSVSVSGSGSFPTAERTGLADSTELAELLFALIWAIELVIFHDHWAFCVFFVPGWQLVRLGWLIWVIFLKLFGFDHLLDDKSEFINRDSIFRVVCDHGQKEADKVLTVDWLKGIKVVSKCVSGKINMRWLFAASFDVAVTYGMQ